MRCGSCKTRGARYDSTGYPLLDTPQPRIRDYPVCSDYASFRTCRGNKRARPPRIACFLASVARVIQGDPGGDGGGGVTFDWGWAGHPCNGRVRWSANDGVKVSPVLDSFPCRRNRLSDPENNEKNGVNGSAATFVPVTSRHQKPDLRIANHVGVQWIACRSDTRNALCTTVMGRPAGAAAVGADVASSM